MAAGSIATQATKLARGTLFAAIAGIAVLGVASFATFTIFASAHDSGDARLMRAREAAARILLADERLTMSAHLAAATGEQRWIDRYYNEIPAIDQAIAEAHDLASPQTGARFDSETRAANDRLVAMEEASFAAVRAGDLAEARRILDSAAYARDKRILDEGTRRFTDAVVREAHAEMARAEIPANALLPLMALISIGGAAFMWRRLRQRLKGSEAAFEDAATAIRDLSMRDALTGLANRRALRERLDSAIARANASRAKIAVFVVNLDAFKAINEAHGHAVGDLVLKEAARRISGVLTHGELAARDSGDEFIIVSEFATEAGARRLAHRLVEVLCQPTCFDGSSVHTAASIGVAIFPTVASGAEELVRKAEFALARAKSDARGAVRLYDLSMDVEINERQTIEKELRAAVEKDEVRPYFQPIVDLRSGAITGFEILARWRHPTRGLIHPSEFIRVAERIGLMRELTASVLRQACQAARCMPQHVALSLNVAPQQIQEEWLTEKVTAVLRETGLSPHRLAVEVSETALVADLAAAKRVIVGLKALGVRVSLDDFGAGYSSLCYLSELPFDAVKIDAGFIRTLREKPESAKIVTAIIGLSRSMGLATVAESVETEAQADFLRSLGCDAAQGYLFGKPMPAAEAALAFAPRPDTDAGRAIA